MRLRPSTMRLGAILMLLGASISCGDNDGGSDGSVAASEVQIYNNLAAPLTGTYTVRSPAGTRAGELAEGSGALTIVELDLRVGDEVTIEVMPYNYSNTCTVAARAAELTYVNAFLNENPFGDPSIPLENEIFCACGFEEFAGTDDPATCQR